MSAKKLDKSQVEEIKKLMDKLCVGDRLKHKKIREKLASYGTKSLVYVKDLLESSKHHCRWEAMKLMEEIGDPESIPTFIGALEDEKGDIRWIAAEGLIRTSRFSIKPLLRLLIDKSNSIFILNAAHHVFSELNEKKMLPENFPAKKLMSLLRNTGNEAKLTVLAHKILNEMEGEI